MKVKDLSAFLEGVDPEAEVVFLTEDNTFEPVEQAAQDSEIIAYQLQEPNRVVLS